MATRWLESVLATSPLRSSPSTCSRVARGVARGSGAGCKCGRTVGFGAALTAGVRMDERGVRMDKRG
eukprot:2089925-Pleurochrysis_carterae.AAC.1